MNDMLLSFLDPCFSDLSHSQEVIYHSSSHTTRSTDAYSYLAVLFLISLLFRVLSCIGRVGRPLYHSGTSVKEHPSRLSNEHRCGTHLSDNTPHYW